MSTYRDERRDAAASRRRRRDRRGRGMRGPLAPPQVPLSRSRSERFDDLVSEAVQQLERRWSEQLADVEFAVADVPPGEPEPWAAEPVPLGQLFPATEANPARIVVYRRPLEARAASRRELGALVHEVVVEEVAEFLGLEPENVDSRYDEGED